MSSKSKQFQLVRRLDAKLQALSTEIQDLSPYEREQTGLCRWVPKKSIFDDSGGDGDGGTRQRPQSPFLMIRAAMVALVNDHKVRVLNERERKKQPERERQAR